MIKGGVAIERRLGASTRATKDFDTIFYEPTPKLLARLDEAFRDPYDDWTLRRYGEPEDLGKAQRITIKLEYNGRAWATVPLEVSAPEGAATPHETVGAFDLKDFGLTGPEQLPCLPIRRQLAQKIHAVTKPPALEGGENHRFRDLYDIWRLKDEVPVDYELRAECKQVFRIRDLHLWPPEVSLYPSWPPSLAAMASAERIDCPEASVLAAQVQEFIQAIDLLSEPVFAQELSEIQGVLYSNTDLKDRVYALVESAPIAGKVTEGTDRIVRFRSILERLVAGEIDVDEAIRRTEQFLGPADSPYRGNSRVFPDGWPTRLIRTQYSRFYNQAVAEELLTRGESRCFVPHSSREDEMSPCSQLLAGKEHETKVLYDLLVKAYALGEWDDTTPKIPNHPHCTHVIAPIENV